MALSPTSLTNSGILISWDSGFELYEHRLGIHREVVKILRIVARDADMSIEDLFSFISATAEADFLFEPEIREYIDEIYSRGWKLRQASAEQKDLYQEWPPEYDHSKIIKEKQTQFTWLVAQLSVTKDKFMQYL